MLAHDLATLALLVGLELVLGIDNILLISILTSRLPETMRARARYVGLGLALGLRIAMLFGVTALLRLNAPLVGEVTGKGLILIAGGLFLLFKAVREIHHVVNVVEEHAGGPGARNAFGAAVLQIALIDLVFSIDSVITAVGLTDHLHVIIVAVVVSFALVLAFANRVAEFIHRHPALKILALSFLVTIGVTLFMEGLGFHVPKTYIYLPMGFSLVVELLQMRHDARRKALSAKR